jgi:mercuric ion transport protein
MHICIMTIKEDHHAVTKGSHAVALTAAGILGAVAASSCCLLPLLLVSVGVSGAWIGNLTALAAYWRTRQVCEDEACERPLPRPAVKVGLWLGTMLILSALLFPRIAAMLGGI